MHDGLKPGNVHYPNQTTALEPQNHSKHPVIPAIRSVYTVHVAISCFALEDWTGYLWFCVNRME